MLRNYRKLKKKYMSLIKMLEKYESEENADKELNEKARQALTEYYSKLKDLPHTQEMVIDNRSTDHIRCFYLYDMFLLNKAFKEKDYCLACHVLTDRPWYMYIQNRYYFSILMIFEREFKV